MHPSFFDLRYNGVPFVPFDVSMSLRTAAPSLICLLSSPTHFAPPLPPHSLQLQVGPNCKPRRDASKCWFQLERTRHRNCGGGFHGNRGHLHYVGNSRFAVIIVHDVGIRGRPHRCPRHRLSFRRGQANEGSRGQKRVGDARRKAHAPSSCSYARQLANSRVLRNNRKTQRLNASANRAHESPDTNCDACSHTVASPLHP